VGIPDDTVDSPDGTTSAITTITTKATCKPLILPFILFAGDISELTRLFFKSCNLTIPMKYTRRPALNIAYTGATSMLNLKDSKLMKIDTMEKIAKKSMSSERVFKNL
jgi:hypothetical protein